ncbi:ABC transporter substrate-binding protein [Maliponia aquimaris]|uniref:Alkanesulfonate transporter substrate-binding subunit n=1 Tax=Maliponia aquimaris TaxID=1673631 RepID=A0A238K999_9RHOB|nr:ABC transporter substrate-binding protein [Maliponia aquimaris]SMX39385.1 alkanesulfonate transporter substrate-binding subunit [Maliponia aquimaris]
MRTIRTIAAATVIATGGAASADTVNVGLCVSWPGYAMLEVARQKDLLPGHDLNLTIFEDPLGGHAALAAGQIDVYECTADYTPLIVDRGTDVVNVGFMNPSYGVDHIILSPDVEVADLPGRKVAAPQAYIGHLLMGIWLDSMGITPDQVDWVNLNADEAVGPMMSGDLSAAYMYEPWISKVLEARPGSRSIVDTGAADVLQTGIFMDALYMNKNFIAENRDTALAVLKARWDGLGYWNANVAETNQLLADYLQWPVEDIGYVIGTDGKSFEGGIYMFDFDESARLCGVLDGDGPFGMANGSMVASVALTNEWWIKLGLMDKTVDPAAGVDCSLMGDLVASGYRQTLTAR